LGFERRRRRRRRRRREQRAPPPWWSGLQKPLGKPGWEDLSHWQFGWLLAAAKALQAAGVEALAWQE
jgi:hypothetical protein